LLVAPQIDEPLFRSWFRTHAPDVVIGHRGHYVDWMNRLEARLPETHGFLALNADMCDRPCAAIDQQPRLIGARGAELLIGQLLRGEMGVPHTPCNLSVPAVFRPGPTLRPSTGSPEPLEPARARSRRR
jgi:LacI family transcriptional regulator